MIAKNIDVAFPFIFDLNSFLLDTSVLILIRRRYIYIYIYHAFIYIFISGSVDDSRGLSSDWRAGRDVVGGPHE